MEMCGRWRRSLANSQTADLATYIEDVAEQMREWEYSAS